MNNELKELITAKLDVLEFLDILGWDVSDLVHLLEEHIDEEQIAELERASR